MWQRRFLWRFVHHLEYYLEVCFCGVAESGDVCGVAAGVRSPFRLCWTMIGKTEVAVAAACRASTLEVSFLPFSFSAADDVGAVGFSIQSRSLKCNDNGDAGGDDNDSNNNNSSSSLIRLRGVVASNATSPDLESV